MAKEKATKSKGSVLVVGGGIGGVQAALDMADAGFKVYMVEKTPSIGGVMSQLDKTFPTNDCSMCILSPKLVEAGRHNNIELISMAEVIEFSGEPGNFKAKILKHPRYVSLDDCKGCGDCADACPVNNRVNIYEEGLMERKAIYRPFDQAMPSAFAIEKLGIPPCRARCPLHVNPQGYVNLIKIEKYEEALALIREKNPFPAITGRICTHPCETACERGKYDEPIAIDFLKRFVADYEIKEKGSFQWDLTKDEPNGKKVAIVGAGPAGLMCAHDLARKGYDVTIYEELPKPGGMLYVGIPPYRLPRDILFGEVELLEKLGVKFVFNTRVGKDITVEELRKNYDALFIAIGAHKSKKLRIPGEDLEGVYGAVEFLREVNLGGDIDLTGKVVGVVGGGNAAIDAARTSYRLGAKKVIILYRRTIAEMPANPEEIEEAQEEGIDIQILTLPVKAIGEDGKLVAVECQRMKLGEPDESGRRRPIPIEGSEFTMELDMLIPAISQEPNLENIGELGEISTNKWNAFDVDEKTLMTNVEGIFAGGDAVTGPKTFIDAMAAGRKAAISIDRFVRGEDLLENRNLDEEGPFETDVEYDGEEPVRKPRAVMPTIPLEKRKSFDEVYLGFTEEQAKDEASRCLACASCAECFECVRACEADAIIHDMLPEIVEVEVGSAVLAPGFDEFDASLKSEYGFGRFPNVVTSIQFERIMSASGPYKGHILRPGDKKHPKKIAWIQCVGSRDEKAGKPYCSSVCCMYATKEAVIAREHAPDIEPTIFYMDMRSFGKDFDKYIDRAENEYGVRYIRSRVAKINEIPETGNLVIKYETESGELVTEEFEMVVLSVGLDHPQDADKLAEVFGIGLNEFKFAETKPFSPMETSREGVYVSGAFSSPKDIPETVAQSSGAAAMATSLIADARGTEVSPRVYPPQKDVRGEKPRIGVFVCHCGINIGGVVDVPAVTEYAKTLPYVVYAEDNLYTCSQDTQDRMKEIIKEYNLNRVVVASCTPRTHEPLFQETIAQAGLNRYLFAMANIRDQDSWVHQKEPVDATEKAKDLVRMEVAKAALLEPLTEQQLPITKRALIIGGGLTGMRAAIRMADQGFETFLVERNDHLGGNATHIMHTIQGKSGPELIKELEYDIKLRENIKVFLNANIEEIEGFVGNYKTTIDQHGKKTELEHGVVIVATGAKEYEPNEYGYGKDPRIVKMSEFEKKFADDKLDLKGDETIVLIQCVGSRNDEHPYCSRFCCQKAVLETSLLKEKYPDLNVFVLYRDIRTYGFTELQYTKARKLGVHFIRFDEEKPPQVEVKDGKIQVIVEDKLLKANLMLEPEYLVLNAGIVAPKEENEKLAKMLKVPINDDGFFLEAHMKLRPVDFATDGVFLAGLAHAPKTIEESLSQADAAVSRAAIILSKDFIETPGTTASVNEFTCVGCGYCASVCAYNAIELVEKKVLGKVKIVAEVNPALCKGCGACASSCRSNSIDLKGFTNAEILNEVYALAWA